MQENEIAWIEKIPLPQLRRMIGPAQVALYVMCGGGLVACSYAEQPASAYRDLRCCRAPYGSRKIERARRALIAMAERCGLDPNKMPPMSDFGNLGVF